ncbi:MAG: A-macroglobulin complement component, partial [Planctomycetes bacterium]|nr:A-macroglobulin complement component [Planctomycetota bacterium]
PNTLVLNLLEANGDDVPVVAARARSLLPAGYRKITGYECKQKGYEWFGADPGHEALTAYGLLQFADMAKVHDVDAAMVDRTRAWLMARRDGKGNFLHGAAGHHSWGGGQPTTNAYVTYALLQSGTPAADLKVELDALVARAATEDAYELALIACALHLAKRPEATTARAHLRDRQEADGSLRGTTSITNSGGNDLAVEATGFAILAWLPDPAFAGAVRRAIEFVQHSRSGSGTFGATQATIAALRALTAYATANRATRTPGTVRVFAGDRQLAERAFTANENGVLTFELWSQLAAGEHELRVEVEGGGTPLAWTCEVAYHAEQPADDPTAPLAVATTLRAATAAEGGTVALDVVVRNTTATAVPTPIAIVGLPAGCELPTRVLEDLQRSDAFAFWELRGRELVLYWRELAAGAEQTLTLDLVARVPGTSTGPAARAYPYYSPTQKRWAAPLALTVTAQ